MKLFVRSARPSADRSESIDAMKKIHAIALGSLFTAITFGYGCNDVSDSGGGGNLSLREELAIEDLVDQGASECVLSETQPVCDNCATEWTASLEGQVEAQLLSQAFQSISQQMCAAIPFCGPPAGVFKPGPHLLSCQCDDGTSFDFCWLRLNPQCEEIRTQGLCEAFCRACGAGGAAHAFCELNSPSCGDRDDDDDEPL